MKYILFIALDLALYPFLLVLFIGKCIKEKIQIAHYDEVSYFLDYSYLCSINSIRSNMYFKDIIGQEEIKKRLIHSAQTGVVPHAQLFTEQGGAGAFPLTLAYARYLNCTNRTETDSCGHCPSCLKYNELAHPDLHFVFPIVSKKDKKKDVCDDYLTEWRGFLKDRPYFDIDGWLDYIDAGNSQALIYSKESDEIIRKLSL